MPQLPQKATVRVGRGAKSPKDSKAGFTHRGSGSSCSGGWPPQALALRLLGALFLPVCRGKPWEPPEKAAGTCWGVLCLTFLLRP